MNNHSSLFVNGCGIVWCSFEEIVEGHLQYRVIVVIVVNGRCEGVVDILPTVLHILEGVVEDN